MTTVAADQHTDPTAARPTAPTTTDTGPGTATTPARGRSALVARRAFLVATPLLAGAFAVVGAVADPAAGVSGTEMIKSYIENPDPLQWKSTGYHWAYAFWIAPALLLAGLVRGKGAWLANVAALLGFAGMVTLPGMLMIDWVQSAAGQLYGLEGTLALENHMMATMWGPKGFMIAGMGGWIVSLPLAVVAQWRAGRMRWWAPAATVLAYVAFLAGSATWWACALTAVFLGVLAFAIARSTRDLVPPRG